MKATIMTITCLAFAALAACTVRAETGPRTCQVVYYGDLKYNTADYVILDLFGCTQAQVDFVKSKGAKPIAYFSVHHEGWRPYLDEYGNAEKHWPHPYRPKKIRKLGNWPNEWVVEFPSYKDQLLRRIAMARRMGFWGIDPDNVDQKTSWRDETIQWLHDVSEGYGLAMGLKNYREGLPKFGKQVDFFVIEATAKGEIDTDDRLIYKPYIFDMTKANWPYERPAFRMINWSKKKRTWATGGIETPSYIYPVWTRKAGNRF